MIEALNMISTNLDMDFAIIFSIVAFVIGIIFYAQDIKVGLLAHTILFGLVFALSYVNQWLWSIPLIIFLTFIVILSLSLFLFVDTLRTQGGLI